MKLCQYLDVSLDHLPHMDRVRVIEDESNGYPYGGTCWVGSFVWTREDPGELLEEGYSQAIVDILRAAHEAGANLVRFDNDGDLHEGFPLFRETITKV